MAVLAASCVVKRPQAVRGSCRGRGRDPKLAKQAIAETEVHFPSEGMLPEGCEKASAEVEAGALARPPGFASILSDCEKSVGGPSQSLPYAPRRRFLGTTVRSGLSNSAALVALPMQKPSAPRQTDMSLFVRLKGALSAFCFVRRLGVQQAIAFRSSLSNRPIWVSRKSMWPSSSAIRDSKRPLET